MIINHVSTVMGRERVNVADVCKGTGLARNTVSALYKAEAKRVDFETLDKLATFLNCNNTDDLIQFVNEDVNEDNDKKPGQ